MSPFYGWAITALCVYPIWFTHPSVFTHLGFIHVLAIVHSAAMTLDAPAFKIIVFSGYVPRTGIAGSYDTSLFSF